MCDIERDFEKKKEEVCHLWHTWQSRTVPQQLRPSIFRGYILPVGHFQPIRSDNHDRIYISSTRLIQPHLVLFTSLYRLQLPIENDLNGVTSFCTPASDAKLVNLFFYDGTLDKRNTVQYHKYDYSKTNVNLLTKAQNRLRLRSANLCRKSPTSHM